MVCGSESICFCVTVVPLSDVRLSRVPATTTGSSASGCSSSVRFSETFCPTRTVMRCVLRIVSSGAVTTTQYVPGGSAESTYSPVALLVVRTTSPVAVCVATMLARGVGSP